MEFCKLLQTGLCAAFGLVATAAASAAILPTTTAIDGLFNTGVDATGSLLAAGDTELHYTVVGPVTDNNVLVPNKRWTTDPNANWIGPVDGTRTAPVGDYVYNLTFDLSDFVLSTVEITGQWSSDNNSEIFLNGNATGFTAGDLAYQSLHAFSLNSGFVNGLNTLTFEVENIPGRGTNPAALLVTDLSGTGVLVPEPGSLALLGTGALMMALRRRK